MKRVMLLMVLVNMFVYQGLAAYIYWKGAGGSGIGDFESPANWTSAQVPGVDDWAVFNHHTANTNYVVTFNSDMTNIKALLRISLPSYETVFNMNQHVWTMSTMEVGIASGGALTFTNGTLRINLGDFTPDAGDPVPNLMLSMKDVVCEITDAKFGAGSASFEGGTLNISNTLSVGVAGLPVATLKLDKEVQCDVTNNVSVGAANGATGELINVNGALRFHRPGYALYVGESGHGTMTLNGGSTFISNITIIGLNSTSVGNVTLTGGSNTFGNTSLNMTLTVGYYGKGSLLVTGGTNNVGGTVLVGSNANGEGEITVTNGLLTIGRFLHVGHYGSGVLNVTGGEMRFVNASDPVLSIARYANTTGTVSISGGVLDVNGKVWLGGSAAPDDPKGGSARLVLSGKGVLRTKTMLEREAVATSQLFFDGGTLIAAADGTLIESLDDVRLTGNGMVVDTDGYDVSVVPTLRNAEGEAGSIIKKGMGTLTLTGSRTATGSVSVLNGTLVVSGNVAVSAGTSRIDGVLSLESDKRLIVAAGAALAGTGSVARVTLAADAVLARSKADNATAPLNVSDCTANGHLAVALSGYALTDLLTSLPLLKVPTATFVKPTSTSVTLNGVVAPSIVLKYTQSNDATILNVKYNSGTVIIVR